MTSVAEAVGIRVRELRLARDLSQGVLARRSGMNRPNIVRVERGVHEPTLTTLARIARALGTTVADLVATVEAQ